jgi:hypothetical protein
MSLLGIATKQALTAQREPKKKKTFRSDKTLLVASPMLPARLKAAAPAGQDRETSSESCWNFSGKRCKRKLPLRFHPMPRERKKRAALRGTHISGVDRTGSCEPTTPLFVVRAITYSYT